MGRRPVMRVTASRLCASAASRSLPVCGVGARQWNRASHVPHRSAAAVHSAEPPVRMMSFTDGPSTFSSSRTPSTGSQASGRAMENAESGPKPARLTARIARNASKRSSA